RCAGRQVPHVQWASLVDANGVFCSEVHGQETIVGELGRSEWVSAGRGGTAMRRANWRVPALWAIAGGVIGYLAIASAGVGASPTFADVSNPHDPQRDIFALRAARHRLVGVAGGGGGGAARLGLGPLRSPRGGGGVRGGAGGG